MCGTLWYTSRHALVERFIVPLYSLIRARNFLPVITAFTLGVTSLFFCWCVGKTTPSRVIHPHSLFFLLNLHYFVNCGNSVTQQSIRVPEPGNYVFTGLLLLLLKSSSQHRSDVWRAQRLLARYLHYGLELLL